MQLLIKPNNQFSILITPQNDTDANQCLKFVDRSPGLLPGSAAEWKDNHIHSPYL